MAARVTAVEPLEGYRLRLVFDDGAVTEADFSEDLWGPMAEPLRDAKYFKRVRVDAESRTIRWPNGFDPDPDVLHGDHEPAHPSKLRVTQLESLSHGAVRARKHRSVDSQFDSQSARTTPDEGGRPRTKGGRVRIRNGRRRTSTDAPGP